MFRENSFQNKRRRVNEKSKEINGAFLAFPTSQFNQLSGISEPPISQETFWQEIHKLNNQLNMQNMLIQELYQKVKKLEESQTVWNNDTPSYIS